MKFDPITFINTLMGRGLTWEHASCAVTLFDVMLRDDRRKAAERSRKHREKRLAEREVNASSRPLSDSISSTESKEQAREVVSKKVKKNSFLCPEDFKPMDAHYARGANRGFSPADVDGLAEDMVLWSRAKGEKKLCWSSAFHRWIKTTKKQGLQNGQPTLTDVVKRIGEHASQMQSGNSFTRPTVTFGVIPGGKAE